MVDRQDVLAGIASAVVAVGLVRVAVSRMSTASAMEKAVKMEVIEKRCRPVDESLASAASRMEVKEGVASTVEGDLVCVRGRTAPMGGSLPVSISGTPAVVLEQTWVQEAYEVVPVPRLLSAGTRTFAKTTEESRWGLVTPAGTEVEVSSGALKAARNRDEWMLPAGSRLAGPSSMPWYRRILSLAFGVWEFKQVERHRILPVHAIASVIGSVSLRDGRWFLGPHPSHGFWVLLEDASLTIARLRQQGRGLLVLAIPVATVAAMHGFFLFQKWKHLRQLRLQNIVDDDNPVIMEPADPLAPLREETAAVPSGGGDSECGICMVNARNAVFECGHRVCAPCAVRIMELEWNHRKCPTCRHPVDPLRVTRLYDL